MKLKYVFQQVEDRNNSFDIPLLSVSKIHGVVRRDEISDNGGRAESLENYRVCRTGDLVINRMSAYSGSLGVAQEPGLVSPDYLILRYKDNLEPRYVHYIFRSHFMVSLMGSLVKGIGSVESGQVRTPRLNWSDLGEVDFSFPPLEEQRAIADYLDSSAKTTASLVEALTRLNANLDDRRLSLIDSKILRSRPDAETIFEHPSDPWLQNVPRDWTYAPLKSVVLTTPSGVWGEDPEGDEGIPVATTAQISPTGNFDFSQMQFRLLSHRERDVGLTYPGDILVVKASGSATNVISGKVGLVTHSEPSFAFGNFLMRLRCRPQMQPAYLTYFLMSRLVKERVRRMVSTTTYPNLKVPSYLSQLVPIPPLSEQTNIVADIDAALAEIDQCLFAVKQLLDLLEERRRAEIQSAIIGKLDVGGTDNG
jgi:type I restriction enzyme S subunit